MFTFPFSFPPHFPGPCRGGRPVLTCLRKLDFCDYKCATENIQYKSNKGNVQEEIQTMYTKKMFFREMNIFHVKLKPGVTDK